MSNTPHIHTGDEVLLSRKTESIETELSLERTEQDDIENPEDNLLLDIYFLNEPSENAGVWLPFTYIEEFLDHDLRDLELGFVDGNAQIQCKLCTESPDRTVNVYSIDPTETKAGTLVSHKKCMKDLQREIHSFYNEIQSTEELLSHIL